MSASLLGSRSETTTLGLLRDPADYTACRWDLTKMARQRDYWLGLFERHLPSLLEQAVAEAMDRGTDQDEAKQRAGTVSEQFNAFIAMLRDDPTALGEPLTIMHLCLKREQVLSEQGFNDPYRLAKHRENEAALELLPGVLRQLDALDGHEQQQAVVKAVFAGNIFDLGATQTVERFQNESVDFQAILEELKNRPWLVDDLDALLERLSECRHRQALLFVDNAGPDMCIGMIAFTRYLLNRGTDVILTANTHASLNDVTADELKVLIQRIGRLDVVVAEALQAGRLRIMANGNGAPLIDLSRLDPRFIAAVDQEPIDLVVLEGMGRGIESNFDAQFTCDAMKIAMVKDHGVAEALGGELYDLVLRYDPPAAG